MKKVLRPILTKAEEYNDIPDPQKGNPRSDNRPSYEVARNRLVDEIINIEQMLDTIPSEYIMDDVVLSLRMRIDRSSKSDHPTKFLKGMKLKEIGTKKWSKVEKQQNNIEKTKFGKDIFVLTNRQDLYDFKKFLEEDLLDDSNKDTIRSIENLYLDDHSNILKSFNSEWSAGRVEVILHPFLDLDKEDDMLIKFSDLLEKNNVDLSKIKIKKYEKGPIFISMIIDINILNNIKLFNPLRTIHPLIFRGVNCETLESEEDIDYEMPKISENEFVPDVTIGMFDGGITSNHKVLSRYVIERNLTNEPKNYDAICHGNAVAGVMLFGDLKEITSETLPIPTVKVESFRVFPLKDNNDIDLYEIIDYIEEVVPKRPDIKVFNLSFGPVGPIEDDIISRFTYSLDRLSKDGERIFVIAVGNDGEYDNELGRIQAPADTVNNIAVGGYTFENGNIIRAPYSCFGDGREGAKVKPDVMEYGGDDYNRMHFLSPEDNKKLYGSGTSFAAPSVSRKLAEILGYSSIQSPRTAKALMIQTSDHPNGRPDKYLGFGVVKKNYMDILECDTNKVTFLYESNLLKAKRAKIKIPFVKDLDFKGKVEISWTICVNTDIDPSDSDDYTNMSIEDTFYPNAYKYRYTHPNTSKTKIMHNIKDEELISEYEDVGWNKSSMPVSKSNANKKYLTEQERRENFKWDTVMKKSSGPMQYKGVEDPFIIIHALSRDKGNIREDRLHYSIALTIEYIDCKENVYEETVKEYSLLEKAQITNINEIMISSGLKN